MKQSHRALDLPRPASRWVSASAPFSVGEKPPRAMTDARGPIAGVDMHSHPRSEHKWSISPLAPSSAI
jgi:hypothetical protein